MRASDIRRLIDIDLDDDGAAVVMYTLGDTVVVVCPTLAVHDGAQLEIRTFKRGAQCNAIGIPGVKQVTVLAIKR